jgi:hypothetical protein
MNIQELIEIAEKRLVYLSQLKSSAMNIGDMDQVAVVDAQIAETQDTLNALKSLG